MPRPSGSVIEIGDAEQAIGRDRVHERRVVVRVGDLGLVADRRATGRAPPGSSAPSGPPRPATSRCRRGPPSASPGAADRRATTASRPWLRAGSAPRRGGRASARSATSRTPGRSRPAGRARRRRGRGRPGCRRARARGGRASVAGRGRTAPPAAWAASATYQSRWRAWRRAVSPRAASCSAAYSRIVSRSRNRVSPPATSSGLIEALVEQGHHPVDDVAADLRRRPADRLRRREVEPAGEHRQAVEQPLGVLVEDVVAPGDRGAQGLLARRQVARAGGQQVELVLEPAEDRLGRQELDPRGGQLDGQRHAVEPGADGRHRGRVLVGDGEARPDRHRALDEQAHGGVLLDRGRVDDARLAGHGQSLEPAQVAGIGRCRQARHRVLLLARDVQGRAAGDDDLDPRVRSAAGRRRSVRPRRPARSCRARAARSCRAASRRAYRRSAGRSPPTRRRRRRSWGRPASGRGSARAARRTRHPRSRPRRVRRAGATVASCPCRPARSGSAAGSCRAGSRPRPARRRDRRRSSAGSAGCWDGRRASAARGTRTAARRR